jgi:hypothetical protein
LPVPNILLFLPSKKHSAVSLKITWGIPSPGSNFFSGSELTNLHFVTSYYQDEGTNASNYLVSLQFETAGLIILMRIWPYAKPETTRKDDRAGGTLLWRVTREALPHWFKKSFAMVHPIR